MKMNNKWIQNTAAAVMLSTATLSSTIIGMPNSASAGLLDEYGTDFKTITKVAPPETTKSTTTTAATNNVEISPTLRGCK